jgi:hypothetical protein
VKGNLLEAEARLPADILQRATLRGNEYAWKRADLPIVFASAESAGIANLGGQVQFRVPDGTCELYWHSFDASNRQPGETPGSWVSRSRQEAEASLLRIPSDAELVAEGLQQFEFLREKAAQGVDVGETLCFVCYFAIPD